MRWSKMLTVVGAHAEGEVGQVITGGVTGVPGATMGDKMRHLNEVDDRLRRFTLFEPRGNRTCRSICCCRRPGRTRMPVSS